jgi:hypothetical protein
LCKRRALQRGETANRDGKAQDNMLLCHVPSYELVTEIKVCGFHAPTLLDMPNE